jgi:hypothetical protein
VTQLSAQQAAEKIEVHIREVLASH